MEAGKTTVTGVWIGPTTRVQYWQSTSEYPKSIF